MYATVYVNEMLPYVQYGNYSVDSFPHYSSSTVVIDVLEHHSNDTVELSNLLT